MLKRRGTLAWLAVVALLGAWMMASRPYTPPDEAAHYLRVLGLNQGNLIGTKTPDVPAGGDLQTAWTNHDTREVWVPPAWNSGIIPCVDGQPDVTAPGCYESTYTGDYNPLPYVLPSVVMSVGNGAANGIWFARLGAMIEAALLLGAALALAAFGSGWALLGTLAATTPTVLFLGGSLNPSGATMAAELAVAAGLARWVAGERPMPRWAAVLTLVCAVFLMLAWQLGPLFLAADLIAFAALAGRDRLGRAWHGEHDRLLIGGGVLAVALIVYLVYGVASGALHSSFSLAHLDKGITAALDGYGTAFRGAIAVFGAEDEWMVTLFYVLWSAAVLALVITALLRGTRRVRITVAAVAVLALLFPLVFNALFQFNTGFGLQGRYVQPVLALIPIVAATALELHPMFTRARLQRRIQCVAVVAFTALQVWAWGSAARISGGVNGTFSLLSDSHWHPPGGWLIWFILVLVAVALLLAAAVRGNGGQLRRTRVRASRGSRGTRQYT